MIISVSIEEVESNQLILVIYKVIIPPSHFLTMISIIKILIKSYNQDKLV
jgi:hypothetical protein